MTAYRPTPYRQIRNAGSRSLGQTFDEILGFPPELGDVLRLLYHTGGAWLGLSYALNGTKNPLMKAVGWVLGGGMAVAALLDMVSLTKRACGTHP